MWNCTWNDSLSKQQPVCSASPLHNIFKMQLRWVKGFKNLWSVARLQLRTKTPGFIGEASFEVVKFVCKNETDTHVCNKSSYRQKGYCLCCHRDWPRPLAMKMCCIWLFKVSGPCEVFQLSPCLSSWDYGHLQTCC